MLEQTISRSQRLFPAIDPGAHWDGTKHMWTFRSGYRYQFGQCKDEDSWQKYLSSEYSAIYYDELTQFTREQYEQINTRLRSADPVLKDMLRIRAATNPAPGWVRDYFIDPAPHGRVVLARWVRLRDGTKQKRTRLFLPATLYDNPDPAFVAQYEANLADKPKHIRQALLYGDWYVQAGAFFASEWDSSTHVVRPFRIPPGWTIVRCMDWGYKSWGCVLWAAVDPDDNLIVIREYSFRKADVREVAKRIKEIEIELGVWNKGKNRSRITGPADTQLWEQRGDFSPSKAEEMARAGVPWVQANKKSRANNAQRVASRLIMRGENGLPGLSFFEGCVQCRRTIPSIQADPNNSEEPLKGGDDHWYDAISYLCAYRAPKTDIENEWAPRRQDDDEDDEPSRSARRGQYGYGDPWLN